MGLRFFADHCVPTSIVQALADAGHDVHRLRDYIPKTSDDSDVIAKSEELDAILVSLNGDFSDIVRYPPADFGGIIAIQVRNHPETIPAALDRLLKHVAKHSNRRDYKGTLLIVEPHRIRIR